MIHGASFAAAGVRPTALGGRHPATALAALVLGLVGAAALPAPFVLGQLVLISAGLAWTGLGPARQAAALRPWIPVAVLVLGVHTLTTVSAAPLGRPSLAGLLAGCLALARVGLSVAWLGLYLRVMSLDDLTGGLGWWLRPLGRLGFPVEDLALALAVALGTAPAVLGEGRRILAVMRMRRAAGERPRDGRWTRFRRDLMDRARVAVPLLETLVRRGEALSLSLRRRRPRTAGPGAIPVLDALVLVCWAAALVWLAFMTRGGAA